MDPRHRHSIRNCTALALIALCAIVVASPFKISMTPLYSGDRAIGAQPMTVNIINNGSATTGVIHMSSFNRSIDYPVDLAEGVTRKVVYPDGSYGDVEVTLDAKTGRAATRIGIQGYNPSTNILVIGDDLGAFDWLEPGIRTGANAEAGSPNELLSDVYCRPEEAQARIIAYDMAAVVVMGRGSERMSDAAVQALKDYATEGGVLLFVGGTSNAALADPRWKSIVPATDLEPKQVSGTDVLETMGQDTLTGPITLWEPKTVQGIVLKQDGANPLVFQSGYGFGRILYTAFDPLDAKLSQWGGRSYAMSEVLRLSAVNQRLSGVNSFGGDPHQVYAVTNKALPAQNDPFSAKLPPFGEVLGILGAYFFAVLPLNFLVLRKMRKAELAWFTAPVLSLGFATLLFRAAGSLYGDGFSTASKGVVVLHSGSKEALFVGDTAFFVPRGGHYDLAMNGVDSIGHITEGDLGANQNVYRSASDMEADDLGAVDTGQLNVANLTTGNLAFRQISYTQRVQVPDAYSVSVHVEGNRAICDVTNGSNDTLTNAVVTVRSHFSASQDVPAHGTRSFVVDLTSRPDAGAPTGVEGLEPLRSALSTNYGAALLADLNGFRPGPQIGEQIEAHTQIKLVVFSDDALGGKR